MVLRPSALPDRQTYLEQTNHPGLVKRAVYNRCFLRPPETFAAEYRYALNTAFNVSYFLDYGFLVNDGAKMRVGLVHA